MIQAFLQHIQFERHLSVQTVLSYRDTLYRLCRHLGLSPEDFVPDKLSFHTLRFWFFSEMEDGMSPRTINRQLSTLRSFYKFLTRNGLCQHNPTLKIIPPKMPKKLPVFFQEKEMERVLEISEKISTFEGRYTHLIIDLFYQTGIRLSEMIGLKDESLDGGQDPFIGKGPVPDHGYGTVEGKDNGASQLRVLGKGNKERIIPIGNQLFHDLRAYMKERDQRFGVEPNRSLFLNVEGKPFTRASIYLLVKNTMALVTTQKKRSPHVLRHTFATTMLNHGADLNAIKELLGHTSLTATQVYTHTTFDQIQPIYEQAHPRAYKTQLTMKTNIQSVNFEATEKLQQFAEKKVNKLIRFFSEIESSQVNMKVIKPEAANNKEVDITLFLPNAKLFASKVSDSFEESVDLCCEALEKQIMKYKEKK